MYILGYSPLSDKSFAKISSQAVACLLILLTLSLEEQKCLILMKPSISIVSFTDHTSVVCKIDHQTQGHLGFFPYLGVVILLHFTFRSVIPFELIFVRV